MNVLSKTGSPGFGVSDLFSSTPSFRKVSIPRGTLRVNPNVSRTVNACRNVVGSGTVGPEAITSQESLRYTSDKNRFKLRISSSLAS